MNIAGRLIRGDQPCYIIAELSANHGGDLAKALELVQVAKDCGADAVKLQTYTADTMTLDIDNDCFKIRGGLWDGQHLYQLYQQAATPWSWHEAIFQKANDLGMHCFSSPFDETAVDFLEQLKVPAYKIASFELVDDPLLKKVAKTGKPVIMSTGMASLEEIEHALGVLRRNGCVDVALLKCVSSYPATVDGMNLRTIADMSARFKCDVGLSDHSYGSLVPIAAVACGAVIVEKHLMLSKNDNTPDSGFSMLPEDFASMVRDVRDTSKALGKVNYSVTEQEQKSLVFRRSVFCIRDMAAGDVFSRDNIKVIRPGHGLAPREFEGLLGKKAKGLIKRGSPLTKGMIEGEA